MELCTEGLKWQGKKLKLRFILIFHINIKQSLNVIEHIMLCLRVARQDHMPIQQSWSLKLKKMCLNAYSLQPYFALYFTHLSLNMNLEICYYSKSSSGICYQSASIEKICQLLSQKILYSFN